MPSSACKKCALDRKSTRLNSSHTIISYAVFCLKKKLAHLAHRVGAGCVDDAEPAALACLVLAGGAGHRAHNRPVGWRAHYFFLKGGGAPKVQPLSPPGVLPA